MNKVLAMLAAACMVLAMVGPSVMANDAISTATVNNVLPEINSLSATDVTLAPGDDSTPGGSSTITASFSDDNGNDDIVSAVATVTGPGPFTGTGIDLMSGTGTQTFVYSAVPGTYTVTLVVTDGSGATTSTATFTVAETNAISVTDVVFGDVEIGTATTGKVSTVTNQGNVDVKFIDNNADVKYDTDALDGIVWGDMTSANDVIFDEFITSVTPVISVVVLDSSDVGFTLTAPVGSLPEDYIGSITFTSTIV